VGTVVCVTEEELRRRAHAWVERTTREQGVPLKLSNPVAIARVAAIFASGRARREKRTAD
jgi:hypothetical protein